MNAPHTQGLQPPSSAHTPVDAPSLNDKYSLPRGSIYLNGSQALVRLMLMQAQRDQAQGLNTGGFVSGYRGSPLGAVDQAFWAAQTHLQQHRITFQPGLNEDLAATAVWGSQQVNLFDDALVDGVFGLWYGKGPGVDRSLDVFKHANAAGTSRFGGVLLAAGDDHGAKSSTLPHQSDHVLKAAMMPVLFPSTVQEILDYGLLGFALSRYCGAWVGFKLIADVVESSASVQVQPEQPRIVLPTDFDMPPDGLNILWPDTPLAQEARLLDHKLYAALAFARANRINHTTIDSPHARLGIVASGKAYQDTLQALHSLGLTPEVCAQVGLRVYKVGMVWPLEPQGIRQFAMGLQEILVVEEKRQLLEYQIKEELYAWDPTVRPRVYGKFDEKHSPDGREGGEWSIPQGRWLLPSHAELGPTLIAKAIAHRLSRFELPADVRQHMAQCIKALRRGQEHARQTHPPVERTPHFCSGCPHNTSTRVPEGSRAMAGIGCHYMAVWMDRNTQTHTQMGGEGVPWIGQAPFTRTPHVFANLGDGTYFHSGILAIRASVAAKVNITYKLLYNDAVAMTGGQHVDGTLTVPQLTRQLAAEGVAHMVIVTDDVSRHRHPSPQDPYAPGVPVHDRSQLDAVQRQLRTTSGVTVLIYEQTCASEKRRRRKRINPITGLPQHPNPAKRVLINPRVCEGCGDCSVQSNCLSVEPLPTEWGTKRTINQSTCNKDTTCLQGLCPSLVTVEGADLLPAQHTLSTLDAKVQQALQQARTALNQLPPPLGGVPSLSSPLHLLVNGVGGTGVVTIGAWLGMAAHLQGLQVNVLDMAGLAQKGGAVYSHVHMAPQGQVLYSPNIATAQADVLLGGDRIVSAHPKTLELLKPQAHVVLNTDTPPTADLIHQPLWLVPVDTLRQDLNHALQNPQRQVLELPAQTAMLALLGDTVYANAFLLGAAWQQGWVPLSLQALQQAITLNGAQVANNMQALAWGRYAVHQPQAWAALLHQVLNPAQDPTQAQALSPEAQLQRLVDDLAEYHSPAFAQRFEARVRAVQPQLLALCGNKPNLWVAFCKAYHRVLAFKDEFEVARHLSNPHWHSQVLQGFQAGARIQVHVAPSWFVAPVWLARILGQRSHVPPLSASNRPSKISLGPWVQPVLRTLARLKVLRFTPFNPFAYTIEAKNQRTLKLWFETLLELVQNEPPTTGQGLTAEQIQMLLNQFNAVKGYGQVRLQSFERVLPLLEQHLGAARLKL